MVERQYSRKGSERGEPHIKVYSKLYNQLDCAIVETVSEKRKNNIHCAPTRPIRNGAFGLKGIVLERTH